MKPEKLRYTKFPADGDPKGDPPDGPVDPPPDPKPSDPPGGGSDPGGGK
jgi:hypothetical protein